MPYRQTIQELEAATLTNAREGLSEKEAAARLQRFGGNELEKKKEESLLKKVAEQFNDPMILILILGAVISIFLHEVMDSVIIVAVITINALIGEERNIVTDIAGTTRDTLNTRYNRFGYDFLLVDTAGLRKKAKVSEDVEFYSVMRSIRAIEESDVCILLIDATRGMEAQDLNIFHLIERNRKGVVIVVNKWDLVEKDGKTLIEYEKSLREKIAPFKDVDIIFASALTKQRLLKVLEAALQVYANRTQKIKTSELNRIMLEAIENYPPPSLKGKYVKIKYITQLPTHAPSFAFYCNLPQYVKDPYKRYLENQIRENWKFTGVPIQIFMRKK